MRRTTDAAKRVLADLGTLYLKSGCLFALLGWWGSFCGHVARPLHVILAGLFFLLILTAIIAIEEARDYLRNSDHRWRE